jgi:MarR family transcriptional regulator, organic hydroperoxide resistance regulator
MTRTASGGGSSVAAVLTCYPKIYFACHMRHVRDAASRSRVLSAHQASILDHLDAVEPTAVHDLASHMGVTASTMSLHLDRLESGGFVRRARSRVDARRVELRLTPAGVRIKQQQKVLDPKLVESMLMQLTDTERRKAIEGLELLARAANELIASREFRQFIRSGAS